MYQSVVNNKNNVTAIIDNLNYFNNDFGKTQKICEEISQGIDFWKYELQTSFEKFMNKYYHEKT